MAINSYERKRGPASENVDIDNAVQPVRLEGAAKSGIALDDAAGIHIDTDAVLATRQLDEEAFWQQPVEVMLAEAQNEDEPQFVEITVNGVYHMIVRGDTKTIPRCHVAVLAAAKQMRLTQKKVTLTDGSPGYEERMVLRLTYPFQVLHDPAGRKGADWLRNILRAPI